MFESQRAHHLFERAEALVEALPEGAREDALALVSASREVFQADFPAAPEGKEALRRLLREKSELTARRGARAMPLAALGRAALARLAGSAVDADFLLAECGQKMAMFGY